MTYVRQTFKYMVKSFWVPMLACLPAAILLGIFTKPMSSLSYLVNYSHTYVHGFKDMLWLITNKYATKYVYPLILIFVALVVGTAYSLSAIEKHFRWGKLMLKEPLKQINNYLLPVLITFILLALILTLYGAVQTGMVTLLHFIISGRGYPSAINLILAGVLSLALFILSMWAACSAMYWTPMMVIYGYSFRDAAAASYRLLDGKIFKTLCGLLVPFIITAALQTVFSFINNVYVSVVLAVLLYLFLMVYVVSYIMISMFSLSGMERRDIKTKFGGNTGGV